MSRRPVPLADALDGLLPDARDALLLRACLGEAAAWEGWLATGPGLSRALGERPRLRRLLPLLHHALGGRAAGLALPTLAILRAATLWEERRAGRIRQILAELLPVLEAAGAAPLALKGVALAATVYPRFHLRHCHDLDLLVRAEALPAAGEALRRTGFRAVPGAGPEHGALLRHRDGLPVLLHARLWTAAGEPPLRAALRERARMVAIDGRAVPVPAPTDLLLHVCGQQGAAAGPGSWAWIADAAMILRRHPPTAADWAGLARDAVAGGVALPVAIRLAGLAARIGLPIPDAALDALAAAARRSPHGERDAALMAAQAASGQPLRTMLWRSGWRSRVGIAGWAIRRARQRRPARGVA